MSVAASIAATPEHDAIMRVLATTSPSVCAAYSQHPAWSVREVCAIHEQTPAPDLVRLASDPHPDVRRAADRTILARVKEGKWPST